MASGSPLISLEDILSNETEYIENLNVEHPAPSLTASETFFSDVYNVANRDEAQKRGADDKKNSGDFAQGALHPQQIIERNLGQALFHVNNVVQVIDNIYFVGSRQQQQQQQHKRLTLQVTGEVKSKEDETMARRRQEEEKKERMNGYRSLIATKKEQIQTCASILSAGAQSIARNGQVSRKFAADLATIDKVFNITLPPPVPGPAPKLGSAASAPLVRYDFCDLVQTLSSPPVPQWGSKRSHMPPPQKGVTAMGRTVVRRDEDGQARVDESIGFFPSAKLEHSNSDLDSNSESDSEEKCEGESEKDIDEDREDNDGDDDIDDGEDDYDACERMDDGESAVKKNYDAPASSSLSSWVACTSRLHAEQQRIVNQLLCAHLLADADAIDAAQTQAQATRGPGYSNDGVFDGDNSAGAGAPAAIGLTNIDEGFAGPSATAAGLWKWAHGVSYTKVQDARVTSAFSVLIQYKTIRIEKLGFPPLHVQLNDGTAPQAFWVRELGKARSFPIESMAKAQLFHHLQRKNAALMESSPLILAAVTSSAFIQASGGTTESSSSSSLSASSLSSALASSKATTGITAASAPTGVGGAGAGGGGSSTVEGLFPVATPFPHVIDSVYPPLNVLALIVTSVYHRHLVATLRRALEDVRRSREPSAASSRYPSWYRDEEGGGDVDRTPREWPAVRQGGRGAFRWVQQHVPVRNVSVFVVYRGWETRKADAGTEPETEREVDTRIVVEGTRIHAEITVSRGVLVGCGSAMDIPMDPPCGGGAVIPCSDVHQVTRLLHLRFPPHLGPKRSFLH